MIDGILENESLAKYTSYKIGGPARWFVSVKDVSRLPEIVAFIQEKQTPYYVLGGGTNTLISDSGFDGLVIKIDDRSITIEGDHVIVASGAVTAMVVNKAVQQGLTGFEWAFGIPGTIGGAIRGNAEAFGISTADILSTVEVIDPQTGSVEMMTPADLQYRYRWSILAEKRRIIMRARFQLKQSTVEECKARVQNYLSQKKERQPLGAHCAGSAFKNIIRASVDRALVPKEMEANEKIYAGWLIDQSGLKGEERGDAEISKKHANFIINRGHATSVDVCELITRAKTAVKERFGLDLEEEIRYLGNDKTTY